MKKVLMFLLAFVAIFTLVACKKTDDGKKDDEKAEIAVVTDIGQLRDGGFNEGTYTGVENYAKANNKTYAYYQPKNGNSATDDDRIAAMEQAIENGAKVIVTPGFLQYAALDKVAGDNPDVKFIFIDGWNFGKSNVTAVSYKEEESGFLAGYAAVKDGYTKLGGTFGGGGANAACNRFAYGYVQGINAAAKELGIEVEAKISFNYGAGFSASPELATQISGWYKTGTQIVFSCGGSMLQSVKSAAAENEGAMIIGVDVDQASESERVLTSAVKGLAASVEKILGEYYAGKWDEKLADKTSNLGAADNATGLPTADASWRFKTFTKAEYEALFAKIVAGEVVILSDTPEKMDDLAVWAAIDLVLTNVSITLDK